MIDPILFLMLYGDIATIYTWLPGLNLSQS